MAIKAVALDIDGTLTNDAKQITPRTKEALLAAQDAGVKVILASGRPIQGLRALAAELELEHHDGLLVSFNGARVIDAQTDEVLFNQPIDLAYTRALVEHIKNYDVIPWFVEDERLIIERGVRHVIEYRGEAFDIVDYERRHCDLVVHEVDDLLSVCDRPQDKLLCAAEPEYLQAMHAEMYAPFTETLAGMFTADFYFEFMASGVSKGAALAGALPKLGIDASEVAAFGDAQNDLSMLEWAGTGVAMGNATDEVKAVANMVTASNNEDGIALALEQLLR